MGSPTLVTARMRCSLTLSDPCCTLSAYAAEHSDSCDLRMRPGCLSAPDTGTLAHLIFAVCRSALTACGQPKFPAGNTVCQGLLSTCEANSASGSRLAHEGSSVYGAPTHMRSSLISVT